MEFCLLLTPWTWRNRKPMGSAIKEFKFQSLLQAAKAKAKETNEKQWFGCGLGLQVLVYPSQRAVYYSNKPRRMLGDVAKMKRENAYREAESLKKQAQREAESRRAAILEPVDDSSITLAEYWPSYIERKKQELKPGSQWIGMLITLYGYLSDLYDVPLKNIGVRALKLAVPVDRKSQTMACKAVHMLSQIIDYAVADECFETNRISEYLRSRACIYRERASDGFAMVPADRLREVWFEPLKNTALIHRAFYALLAFAGFRFNECRLLKWEYVDLRRGLIIIPADAEGANKTQRPLIKPITRQMRRLLCTWYDIYRQPDDVYVFESRAGAKCKPLGETTFRNAPITKGITKIHDFHGFRKSLSTWLNEYHDEINPIVTELCLGHEVMGKIMKTYNKAAYTEKVRAALQLWDDYLEEHALTPEYNALLMMMEADRIKGSGADASALTSDSPESLQAAAVEALEPDEMILDGVLMRRVTCLNPVTGKPCQMYVDARQLKSACVSTGARA